MKKIFLVLAMFISCSLFAEVTQSKTYIDYFDNPISSDAQFIASYRYKINLQKGIVDYKITLSTKKNKSFYYNKESDSISEFVEMYNELEYVIKYVLPEDFDKLYGVRLEKVDLFFFVNDSTIVFGNLSKEGDCIIPCDKIQSFADVIKNVIDKFYKHKIEFESACFPVKPFSK